MFAKEKVIIINQADDKIITEIEYLVELKENVKIIFIADLLDKKSKLRSLFEKIKSCNNSLLQRHRCYFKKTNTKGITRL